MKIQDILEGIDYILHATEHSTIVTTTLVVLIIELIILFIIRYSVIMKINGIKVFNTDAKDIKHRTIIQNHLGYEILIAFIVSLFIISLLNATPSNYLVNTMIAPIIGLLSGIAIDTVYIIPKQGNSLCSLHLVPLSKPPKSNDSESNVTININNNSESASAQPLIDYSDAQDAKLDSEHIPSSAADSDDFNNKIIEAINSIKDVQVSHEIKIHKVVDKADETFDLITKLQESEMIDKKLWLKSKMYECLAKGFVTPREHEQIRLTYYAYTELLHGNGDVKDLYEHHYKDIPIHEDRRQTDWSSSRDSTRCIYGQYDETSEFESTGE